MEEASRRHCHRPEGSRARWRLLQSHRGENGDTKAQEINNNVKKFANWYVDEPMVSINVIVRPENRRLESYCDETEKAGADCEVVRKNLVR